MEKGERQTSTWEHRGKMNPHNNWIGKQEGLSFMTSGKQWDVKLGVLKVRGWLG